MDFPFIKEFSKRSIVLPDTGQHYAIIGNHKPVIDKVTDKISTQASGLSDEEFQALVLTSASDLGIDINQISFFDGDDLAIPCTRDEYDELKQSFPENRFSIRFIDESAYSQVVDHMNNLGRFEDYFRSKLEPNHLDS